MGDRLDRTEKLFSIASSLITISGAAIAVVFWLAASSPNTESRQSSSQPPLTTEQPSSAAPVASNVQADPPFRRKVQIVLIIISITYSTAVLIDVRQGFKIDRAANGNSFLLVPLGIVVLTTFVGLPLFLLQEAFSWFFTDYNYSTAYAIRTLILIGLMVAALVTLGFAERVRES